MDQYETWHAGRHRPWPHCVRWGPSSLPQKGRSPQFSVHVYCGQMSGWIKMPLGREVGLSPGYIVLDGDPAPSPPKPGGAPNFRPCLLWPNGWMDNDATSYGSRPQPRPHCVRRGPSSRPRERGTAASPLFSVHVYCGHGRPSQLLLSSCLFLGPITCLWNG